MLWWGELSHSGKWPMPSAFYFPSKKRCGDSLCSGGARTPPSHTFYCTLCSVTHVLWRFPLSAASPEATPTVCTVPPSFNAADRIPGIFALTVFLKMHVTRQGTHHFHFSQKCEMYIFIQDMDNKSSLCLSRLILYERKVWKITKIVCSRFTFSYFLSL